MARIIVAAVNLWNERRYNHWIANGEHTTRFIGELSELTPQVVSEFGPDYIFFPHWSWKIPAPIYENHECIVFHMTDLPFGRGGSPLQNLILRGIHETQVSALRVVEAMDAGPIYLKRPLCLRGSAEEIYLRASELVFQMMNEILDQRPAPVPQSGPVVEFKRRTPAESEIPPRNDLMALYDFIRMLDAEDYPSAFLAHEGFRYEFTRATLRDGYIAADVRIVPIEKAK